MPLTADEAREFAEDHLPPDVYASEFGTPEEASDDRMQTAFTLSPETVALLKRKKAETGQTLSELVAIAIEKIYR